MVDRFLDAATTADEKYARGIGDRSLESVAWVLGHVHGGF